MEKNIRSIMEYLCRTKSFDRITFSRRREKTEPDTLRETAVLFRKQNISYVQIETRYADGKAFHRNLPAGDAAEILAGMAEHEYRQTDIHTPVGDCEIRFSKKNECHIINRIREEDGCAVVMVDPEAVDGTVLHMSGTVQFCGPVEEYARSLPGQLAFSGHIL